MARRGEETLAPQRWHPAAPHAALGRQGGQGPPRTGGAGEGTVGSGSTRPAHATLGRDLLPIDAGGPPLCRIREPRPDGRPWALFGWNLQAPPPTRETTLSRYRDKVVLVTGGASGIGRALATALAAQGARLVLVDTNRDGLEATGAALASDGGRVRWRVLDVADREAMHAVVDDIYATEGPLDYLFNNAGVCLFGDTHEMTAAQWDRLLAVNVHGVVHGIEAVYPRMVARGAGHIVNIASVAGLVPHAVCTAYSTTKHALVGLSASLRGEAAPKGVRVTVACPGVIDTNLKNTTELVNLDRDKLLGLRFPLTSADRCARVILRGVRWNRAVVTVNPEVRLLWWLYRLAPGAFASWVGPLMVWATKWAGGADPADPATSGPTG